MLRPGRRAATDPSGPVIAVCTGQRCADAHRATRPSEDRSSDDDTPVPDLTELRAAVRATRGAVLVSSGCLGRCDGAALVVLAWRGNAFAEPQPLVGMHRHGRMSGLASWLGGPGPAKVLLDGGALPAPLEGA